MLSKDEILATNLPDEVVDVPEWGGKVRLRGLSAEEIDAYERTLVERGPDGGYQPKDELPNLRAQFVVRCIVDDNGERIFTDEDAAELGKKSGAAIARLHKVARRLSGRDDNEELAARFGSAQSDGSSSE